MIRVPRGQPAPDEAAQRTAIERDRLRLHLPPEKYARDVTIAGPYPVTVNDQEWDEYVLWER